MSNSWNRGSEGLHQKPVGPSGSGGLYGPPIIPSTLFFAPSAVECLTTVPASILAQMNCLPKRSGPQIRAFRGTAYIAPVRRKVQELFHQPGELFSGPASEARRHLLRKWRLIWTAVLPVNTLFCVACSRMFNHPNCPVYDAKDPVGRSMSGSQIRAISGNRHRVLPGEELKTSVASQALRHRAPRPKPEGLVSGGGDVLPPPVSSNPLMQDFITKLQRNFRRNSASLERELKQPNEYGGFRLVLR